MVRSKTRIKRPEQMRRVEERYSRACAEKVRGTWRVETVKETVVGVGR